MGRDGMKHTLLLYNQDLTIFREALHAEALDTDVKKSDGSISALLTRLAGKGGNKFILTTEDLKLIYNGMSLLEMRGRDQEASLQANRILRDKDLREYHPWGYDPIQRFRGWQQFILARV